jgi:membrane protein
MIRWRTARTAGRGAGDPGREALGLDRARLAKGPLRLGAATWPATLRRTGRGFLDDHLLQWSAALTFFAVLSLFPAMLALVALLGLVGSSALQPLIDNVSALAPGTARDLTLDALRNVEQASDAAGPTFALALAAALWSASGYVGAFIPAANVVWDVDEARPLVKKLAVRMLLTVVLLLMIALVALSVVLTGPIAEELGGIVGFGSEAVDVWGYAKWPFLALAVMTLVAVLYWASPNVRHPSWRWVTPGSVLAVALWVLASLGFTAYVNNFGTFNATYGSIGSILVFLIWLWLTNIAILLGAALNAELARTRAIQGGLQPPDREPYLPLRDHDDG